MAPSRPSALPQARRNDPAREALAILTYHRLLFGLRYVAVGILEYRDTSVAEEKPLVQSRHQLPELTKFSTFLVTLVGTKLGAMKRSAIGYHILTFG